ncbi:MAG: glutathione-disulfide reductase [Alphaproteobacteria bacterium]|jgi:glutathione reductase (NADPH)|nr:glutathione-disulfide reductase [Alphaproteobacteria bacterium]MBU1563297.1 glutathione-disulfide reductase [Alphaproteobacteria bacterium]MBU2302020.1 glutathione-disulfide reductase [Alphaproteobacteria bacterium]MBU2367276.1 glutathione-disulfide reductase [Alphaproteobacteria bacterium]
MTGSYDLVVIGAGSGGVRAARMAATYGARVAIIEEFRVGGTCVIRGCVPKKLYVYASRFNELFDVAASFGWQVDASFDWPTLVANKEKEITRLEHAYTANLEKPGVEIIKDRAVVTGPNSVHLVGQDRDLDARYILVATGGHPYIPPIPGAELAITSNEAFDLPALPHSILIEGGGYIAVEFATIFAGLGVNTTIVYRGDCILRSFDDDMRRGLEAGLIDRGIKLIYQTTIKSLMRAGDDISATFSDGVTAPYGAVMFATGRAANTGGLGLEAAGVKLHSNGAVMVDAFSQSSVPSIYAVGDVTGRAALTPVAIREGWYFAETVFNNNPLAVDHSQIPTAVFSEPEIGVIGLTEGEAATHGDIDVYLARFRPMMNTLSSRTERMILKLITEKDGGKVLGCHILGPGAAEMIQLVAIPMGMGASKADFDRAMALHPSAAEELVTFKAPSYTYRDGKKIGG